SLSLESKMTVNSLFSLADAVYHETEMEAPVASGSFHTDGMIVIPCSMKTLSAIATGYDSNLLEVVFLMESFNHFFHDFFPELSLHFNPDLIILPLIAALYQ
ncbi:hypothetical protein NE599_21145, partial [[Clostridium] symbiosum]|uniref:flavoprotein n=1 Tax=Clostridium symbiosum TaxID=1512 RepID=UPI0027415D6D